MLESVAPELYLWLKSSVSIGLLKEATWETEQDMREQYPNLFESSSIPLSLHSWIKVLIIVDVVMTSRLFLCLCIFFADYSIPIVISSHL